MNLYCSNLICICVSRDVSHVYSSHLKYLSYFRFYFSRSAVSMLTMMKANSAEDDKNGGADSAKKTRENSDGDGDGDDGSEVG